MADGFECSRVAEELGGIALDEEVFREWGQEDVGDGGGFDGEEYGGDAGGGGEAPTEDGGVLPAEGDNEGFRGMDEICDGGGVAEVEDGDAEGGGAECGVKEGAGFREGVVGE